MKAIALQICLIGFMLQDAENLHQTESDGINWLSFEELDEKIDQEPKKVLIYFTTSWCTYCRKMDKEVFTNAQVIKAINQNYYAVKFDAESTKEVIFDRVTFRNLSPKNSRSRGIHELALLLAQNQGQFAPPTFIFLDENFEVRSRFFEYLHSQRLIEVLEASH
jgi:thioredoxin-related protein